jgi:hypothetical protein
MERTADFHHHVANPCVPDPDGLFAHAAAFDAAVDVFDAHMPPSDLPRVRLLGAHQPFSTWRLHRLNALRAVQRERLNAPVLPQLTSCWQWRWCTVGEALVMQTTRMGRTQKRHTPGGLDPQEIFAHGPLLLAAITHVLCSSVVGARAGSLGATLTNRGASEGWRVGPLLRVTALAGGVVRPPPGVRTRPPHDDRTHPPRHAGCCVTRAVRQESTVSLGIGASRTGGHGAVAWEAV